MDNWSPESVRIPFLAQLFAMHGVRSRRFDGSSYVLVLGATLNESEKSIHLNVGSGRSTFAAVSSYHFLGSPQVFVFGQMVPRKRRNAFSGSVDWEAWPSIL